jgi:signal transduction histidine kinase
MCTLEPEALERHRVFVSVNDSGVGMSREFVAARLFRPFDTTKPSGMGIGLYQCRELLRSVGGRLLCTSKEGEGSTFYVLL